MSLQVREVPVLDIVDDPQFPLIVQGNWEECANRAMGLPRPDRQAYQQMQDAGMIRAAAVYADGKLVGGVSVLTNRFAHFSRTGACVESLFCLPEYRKQGGGELLLKAARQIAKDSGAPGLYVTAPAGSRLERLAQLKHWRHTNSVFFLEAK